MQKAAKEELPDIIFDRFEETNTGLKKRIVLLHRMHTYGNDNNEFFLDDMLDRDFDAGHIHSRLKMPLLKLL